MIRRTCLLVAATLWLVAPHALGAQTRRINVTLRGFEHFFVLDTFAIWTTVPGTPAETYAAALQVLDSLKMPIVTADSSHGLLLNKLFVARRRMAGRPMSWALHCGSDLTGANADTWRISMAYALFIDPSTANTSRLGVAIAAGANNVEGAYKPPVMCGSTGALEADIAKRVTLSVLTAASARPD